jgi:AraC-like DNA-binding protein
MKAAYENVDSLKGNLAFVAYSFSVPFFEFKWHYHPEFELTLITGGSGKRLIGDSHETFTSGDLVLIGPDLPHTWASEPGGNASAVVIQFSHEFTSRFTEYGECASIDRLLTSSSCGLFFDAETSGLLAKAIRKLPARKGVSRIAALLKILEQLSTTDSKPLSSGFQAKARNAENENRINKIIRYLHAHASEPVTLEKASQMVHLSKSAFCKFFRRMMHTSYSDYLNDIRIGKACRLLLETDQTVRAIAQDSGFESLTYFNRIFLKKKGVTPTVFRAGIG